MTIRNLSENNEFKGIDHVTQRWQTCIQTLGEYLVYL